MIFGSTIPSISPIVDMSYANDASSLNHCVSYRLIRSKFSCLLKHSTLLDDDDDDVSLSSFLLRIKYSCNAIRASFFLSGITPSSKSYMIASGRSSAFPECSMESNFVNAREFEAGT